MAKVPSIIRVAVLRGGPSLGYDASLQTGAKILSVLRDKPTEYHVEDIFISKDGEWHKDGRVVEPHVALQHTDVAFNALVGPFGEEGNVQKLLRDMHISSTGSGRVQTAQAHHSRMRDEVYKKAGFNTLRHELLEKEWATDDHLIEIFRNYLHPLRVKPLGAGPALARVVRAYNELQEAVEAAFKTSERVVVEEWLKGKEVSSSVVEDLRGEKLYSFIPVPSDFSVETHKRIENISRAAHEALGLRHFSSSHFIISPKAKIYIVGTNTMPEFHEDSHLPHALDSVGLSDAELIEHLVRLAHTKHAI